MKNDKTAKPKNDVARRREFRIDRLQTILRIAYAEDLSPRQLLDEMRELRRLAPELSFQMTFPADPNQYKPVVLHIQNALRSGLTALFQPKAYDAVWTISRGKREITRRPGGFGSSARTDLEEGFLNACADLLCGADGERVQPCTEPGCSRLFVKRKKGAYCTEHNIPRIRSKRHRDAMKATVSAEERTLRRYYYHLAALRRRDPKRYKTRLRQLEKSWPERYRAVLALLKPNASTSTHDAILPPA